MKVYICESAGRVRKCLYGPLLKEVWINTLRQWNKKRKKKQRFLSTPKTFILEQKCINISPTRDRETVCSQNVGQIQKGSVRACLKGSQSINKTHLKKKKQETFPSARVRERRVLPSESAGRAAGRRARRRSAARRRAPSPRAASRCICGTCSGGWWPWPAAPAGGTSPERAWPRTAPPGDVCCWWCISAGESTQFRTFAAGNIKGLCSKSSQ